MSRHRDHGWLPTAGQQGAIGLSVSWRAYNIARHHAANGVDPALAARHGAKAADYTVAYWLSIGWITAFFALFLWEPLPLLIWKCGLTFYGVLILVRLKRFKNTDPRYRINYLVPTWVLVLGWVLWIVALAGAGLVYLWNSVSATTP